MYAEQEKLPSVLSTLRWLFFGSREELSMEDVNAQVILGVAAIRRRRNSSQFAGIRRRVGNLIGVLALAKTDCSHCLVGFLLLREAFMFIGVAERVFFPRL